MKNRKIIMIIFASFTFLILSMNIILSQSPQCIAGNCRLDDPSVQKDAKIAYGTSINAPPGSLYNLKNQQVLDSEENPLLAPANQHPQGYNPSFGNGKASFSGPNSQLTTPQGTYPSTNLQRIDQSFTQSLGAIQGIIQLFGQLNLKELIVPKEKKDSGQLAQTLPAPGFSEVTLTNSGDKTNTKFKNTKIGLSDDKNNLISDTNDNSKYGEITTIGNSLKNSIHTNTATTISTAGKSIARVETNDETHIILNNPNKENAFNPITISIIISLLQNNFVSAQQDSGQYVKFEKQNVEVNGHDISVHALKTFENLQAGGNNLEFYSGENKFEFNQQRIMFSRLLKNNPHGVNSISNKLDPNNEYKLQHYTNSMGKLYDDKDIIYITDITANPEKGSYSKLKINKDRMEMFS